MNAIIFDIDGVLVDTSQSYSLAIKKTAEFFLNTSLNKKIVEEYKNKGNLNNDYDCTQAILIDGGKSIKRNKIIKKFQEYYLGKKWNGLINNEKWLLDKKTLGKLSKKYKLSILTGRPRKEAEYTLKLFDAIKYFKDMICMEDVKKGKPDPEGLLKLLVKLKTKKAIYIGDLIDDSIAAKNANIDFIGVIAPGIDRKKAEDVFKKDGVKIILNDINEIGKILWEKVELREEQKRQ